MASYVQLRRAALSGNTPSSLNQGELAIDHFLGKLFYGNSSDGVSEFLPASAILSRILTVDGAGSSLDADTLDGQQGSYYAPLASPAFTGTPTAPTAAAATNTTQLATTAFVTTAVQNATLGLFWKQAVRVASTANVSVSSAPSSIDSVTLSANDRVLLKNQTAPAENGIYIFNGASSAMTRASDADVAADFEGGIAVWVEEGTTNGDTGWTLTTDGAITVGTTALAFAQFNGGASTDAGTGLSKSGNTLSLDINGLSSIAAIEGTDTVPVYDGSVAGIYKASWNTIISYLSLVQGTRQVIAGNGLTGGGDLTANRTFTVTLANLTTETTPLTSWHVAGSDAGSGSVKITWANVISTFNLASTVSPAFTGTPTAPTASLGTNSTQIASTAFVANAFRAFAWKDPVRVASTANVTVSNPGTSTFDGVVLSVSQRILLKDQSAPAENGIYQFNGSGSAMTRVTDMDENSEANTGIIVLVKEGSTNAGRLYELTTDGSITVGTTALTFTQLGGSTVTASNGLTMSGNDVQIAADGVTNARLANMAQNTVKGRITASTGDPEDLTAAQLVTIITGADGAGSSLDADTLDGAQLSAIDVRGKQSFFIPSEAMLPRATNGAAFITVVSGFAHQGLAFDPTTEESADFSMLMPNSWNGSTITFKALYTKSSGTNAGVVWRLTVEQSGDGTAIDTTSTNATTTDTTQSNGNLSESPESGNITMTSGRRFCYCNIARVTGDAGDTFTADAILLGIEVFYTANAAVD